MRDARLAGLTHRGVAAADDALVGGRAVCRRAAFDQEAGSTDRRAAANVARFAILGAIAIRIRALTKHTRSSAIRIQRVGARELLTAVVVRQRARDRSTFDDA